MLPPLTQFSEVQSLRIFIAIVEAGSLAAAARALDVTPSALSQRLRQLESQLKARLLDRDTRKLQLTEEGRLLYERGRDLLGGLDQLVSELAEKHSQLAGGLRIFAPLGFGRRYVAPYLAEFHAMHPGLEISLTLGDRINAHGNDRFDVVIHIGDMQDSSLIAYPIAPNDRILCAAPSYLKDMPAITQPDDLLHHRCLVLRENDEDVTMWQFRQGQSLSRVRVASALSTNDGEVIKQWAIAGRGLMVRSEWHVATALAEGRLVRVLDDWDLASADVVALAVSRDKLPQRVRNFIDYIQSRFQPGPPWRHPTSSPILGAA
jgi:DNA-binding transcriptional LysR family regulator